MSDEEPATYYLDPVDLRKLEAVMRRLYDDRPLSGDQRRDLANAMDAILHGVRQNPAPPGAAPASPAP
jgi:hypothetical protein